MLSKKIIEFNGDTFHANPSLFSESSMPNPFTNETALSIWNKDLIKLEFIKNAGFDVLIIWENEYIKNKELIIKKCLDFLN